MDCDLNSLINAMRDSISGTFQCQPSRIFVPPEYAKAFGLKYEIVYHDVFREVACVDLSSKVPQ